MGKKTLRKSDFIVSQDTISATPGEMLAALRELQGLSQGELSRLTGIAQSNISNMEKGRQSIGRERAITLARALKVHPAVILFPNYQLNLDPKERRSHRSAA